LLEALDIDKNESPVVLTLRSSTTSERASSKELNSVVSTPRSSTAPDGTLGNELDPVEVQDSVEHEHLSSLSSSSPDSLICPEWTGTSQFQVNFVLELQKSVSRHKMFARPISYFV
jgi:hypothetical protein